MICFNSETWFKTHTDSLVGKRVVLFGATGGIGGELCRYILRLGGTLITVDRNAEKAAQRKAALLRTFPAAELHSVIADLEDMAAVEKACEELETLGVDVLIHNAGAYSIPRKTCDSGLDNIFQINFAAPYYITCRLLPLLEARQGRVVAVGSIAHTYSKTDPNDVMFLDRCKASLLYGNAKRRLMAALPMLLREHPAVALAVTHPGITFTGITAHYPPWLFAIIKHPMKWVFMPPKAAALCVVQGLFDTTEPREWIGPSVFHIWGKPRKQTLNTIGEEERRQVDRAARETYAALCRHISKKDDVLCE